MAQYLKAHGLTPVELGLILSLVGIIIIEILSILIR